MKFLAPLAVVAWLVADGALAIETVKNLPNLPEGNVLYRETFPASPGARGENVLDQGWDIIRSRADQLRDIVPGLAPDGVTEVRQNSGAIFGHSDTVPQGSVGGGVNNSPFLPAPAPGEDPVGDGILFASAGFWPFLFFTDSEVPAGTMASDVNSVVFRARNNPGRTEDPADQMIHTALKVDGAWYLHEVGQKDTLGGFDYFGTDLSTGNWATMNVTQLDFTAGTIDLADVTSDFDQPKPTGTVEGWGVYNLFLTNNTRFDYVEFRSDAITSFRTPEPTAVALTALAGLALAARRRAC